MTLYRVTEDHPKREALIDAVSFIQALDEYAKLMGYKDHADALAELGKGYNPEVTEWH